MEAGISQRKFQFKRIQQHYLSVKSKQLIYLCTIFSGMAYSILLFAQFNNKRILSALIHLERGAGFKINIFGKTHILWCLTSKFNRKIV